MRFLKLSSSFSLTLISAVLLVLQSCSPNNVTIQNAYKQYFDETATTGS